MKPVQEAVKTLLGITDLRSIYDVYSMYTLALDPASSFVVRPGVAGFLDLSGDCD